MVAGKVKKVALGFQKSPATPRQAEAPPEKPQSPSPSSGKVSKGAVFSRAFGVYLPRSSSAQVQPRPPPDVAGLLRLVEELRERESRLKTEILEHKLLKESAAIVPLLETQISEKDAEIEALSKGIVSLEAENGRLRAELEAASMEEERRVYEKARIESLEGDNQRLRGELDATMARMEDERRLSEKALKAMESEVGELKKLAAQRDTKASSEESDEFLLSSQRFHHLIDASVKSNLIKNLKSIKNKVASECTDTTASSHQQQNRKIEDGDARSDEPEPERPTHSRCNSEEITESADSLIASVRSRVPRVPKPPPKPSSSPPSPSSSIEGSMEQPIPPPPPRVRLVPAPPPPPPKTAAPPPPPPLPRAKGERPVPAKVRRVPEVVEFYHSLMRRDSSRRESSAGTPDAQPSAANTRDMIGEIENRSAYLLAIKTDVETQGDFIRFLIREVENAAFTNIEDVVPFVKWLDDELSYLVDERAVLKHFSWPEQKADALREAAFGYCDLKKLETEASSFRDDVRQPCGSALKKMQALFEKLEHGVYSLSRMRESATKRYKIFKIPTDWMLESGFACQIKLASVKLAMKYMRRVSAELETGGGGLEEEELIVQGVRFAFRVHQFAGGFDAETMRAFQELRDKAKSCHLQYQNQQHQKFVCRQMTL